MTTSTRATGCQTWCQQDADAHDHEGCVGRLSLTDAMSSVDPSQSVMVFSRATTCSTGGAGVLLSLEALGLEGLLEQDIPGDSNFATALRVNLTPRQALSLAGQLLAHASAATEVSP